MVIIRDNYVIEYDVSNKKHGYVTVKRHEGGSVLASASIYIDSKRDGFALIGYEFSDNDDSINKTMIKFTEKFLSNLKVKEISANLVKFTKKICLMDLGYSKKETNTIFGPEYTKSLQTSKVTDLQKAF